MIYLLFVLIALFSVCFIELFSALMGVVDFGKNIKLYRPCKENIVPYKGKNLVLITIICFAITFAAQVSLYMNTATTVNFVKLYSVLVIVLCAGAIDYKRRIIPNYLIIIGFAFRATIYLYEIFFTETFKAVLMNDLIGFAIGFGFLALVSIITKGALGFGDAKLFGVIGITTGAFCTYSTLLVGLIVSVVVSLINIARKKMGRKDSFPFGPSIAVGYAITVLLTSY